MCLSEIWRQLLESELGCGLPLPENQLLGGNGGSEANECLGTDGWSMMAHVTARVLAAGGRLYSSQSWCVGSLQVYSLANLKLDQPSCPGWGISQVGGCQVPIFRATR